MSCFRNLFKMIKHLFFSVTLNCFVAHSFDPSKIDYCNLRCFSNKLPSSACYCVPGNDRTYVTDNMQKFRQLMVDTHNERRNFIARGGEKENHYDSAANMHILRYDLELEHVARCYLMWQNFSHGHDKCRQVSFCDEISGPGQNIAGYSRAKPADNDQLMKFIRKNWYGELTNLPTPEERKKIVKGFYHVDYKIGHFTQMIWAKHERVGCARAVIPNNPKRTYKFVLMCNYAGPPELCGGNLKPYSVYEVGKPCSKCEKTKCNKDLGGKYDALCGEDVKAPNDPPAHLDGGQTNKNRNIMSKFCIASVILVVVNNGVD